jgi:hypothetical protein
MKLPSYRGWPIIANFSPIDGKWILKTRVDGVPRGIVSSLPLRESVKWLLDWCEEDD